MFVLKLSVIQKDLVESKIEPVQILKLDERKFYLYIEIGKD